MDTWHSDWVTDNVSGDDAPYSHSLFNSIEENNDSPNISRADSFESYGDDHTEKNDAILKPTFKSIQQAKKRLQAFSATKNLKKFNFKEKDSEDGEKSDKTSPKKSKKVLYPDDKAKAVIKEIEAIKKMEGKSRFFSDIFLEDLPKPDIPVAKTVSVKEVVRARSRSLSSEREYFKKREIKCRNFRRKSISPDDHGRRKSPTKKQLVYPTNWTEYKEQNLTIVKDYDLKGKLFPKQKYAPHEVVTRLVTFDTPSPLLEPFKLMTIEDKFDIVPAPFLRVTRSKPPLTYSINYAKNRDGFYSRKQLFSLISRDRRIIMEKLFNNSSSPQPNSKVMHSRLWYSKTWKRVSDAECKVLENSVGLSFLQTYSDEEEENDEEVVVYSSKKENGIKDLSSQENDRKIQADKKQPSTISTTPKKKEKLISLEEPKKTKPQVEKSEKAKPLEKAEREESLQRRIEKAKPQEEKHYSYMNSILEKSDKIKHQMEKSPKIPITKKSDMSFTNDAEKNVFEELTPERKPIELKKLQRDELIETRRAIKELEEELERRKAAKIEEELKEEKKSKKKKQKKAKKRIEEEESDQEKEVVIKKKKKKKHRAKKKPQTEEDSSSSDEKRKKKKNKKGKYKKEKLKRKKEKNKKEEAKESKTSKKDYDIDVDISNEIRKKKKSITDEEFLLTEKKCDEVPKKKKKNKRREKIITTEEEEVVKDAEVLVSEERDKQEKEEVEEEKIQVKDKGRESKYVEEWSNENKPKERKRDKWDTFDIETFVGDFENVEKIEFKALPDLREILIPSEPKHTSEFSKKTSKPESVLKEKAGTFEKEYKRQEEEDRKGEKESYNHDKKSRRSRSESEKEYTKKKKDLEESKIKEIEDLKTKQDDHLKKQSSRVKTKDENEKGWKGGEKMEERDKHYSESRVSRDRDRKSSEKSEKGESQKKHSVRDRHQDDKSEKHQKEKHKSENLYDKLDKVKIKEEPDWDNLRSKRKRHRDTDSKEVKEKIHFPDGPVPLPVEKEINRKEKDGDRSHSAKLKGKNQKREWGTPDTNDYRENWEKDTFPIWESEEDVPQRPKEKLNNSWESDEETFERGHREVEQARPYRDTFDLEIPLNIKPFKRREVINPDIELQLLKRESITLSEERRRLEIEKQRVKELELKVIREVEIKELEDQFISKRRRSTEEKRGKSRDREHLGRWDKKSSNREDSLERTVVKAEKPDEERGVATLASPKKANDTVASLENQYEEFMKAVTSTATPKRHMEPKKPESTVSVSSFMSISDSDSCSSEKFLAKKSLKNDVLDKKPVEVANIESPLKLTHILPKDIPLIPMPAPIEVKPVPVPSPKVDSDKIPKPLINLNLTANIGLDIATKLASPVQDSPGLKPVDSPLANFDIAKLGTSRLATPPSVKSLDFNSPAVTQSPVQKPEETTPVNKLEATVNFASPLTDVSLDSALFDDNAATKESQRLKPFAFTTMVIPSKKLLLDNSNLNLGDSDDECKSAAMSMRSLEEIKKENDTAKVKSVEDVPVEPEKPREVAGPSHGKTVKSSTGEKKDRPKFSSPVSKRQEPSRKQSREKATKKDGSPRRGSHGKRELSPRRRVKDLSPKRRRSSPRRHTSPRRRSPPRKKSSPAKRKHSPKRSVSPRHSKRNSSPRRRSPPRSKSPKMRPSSPKRVRSKSPEKPIPVLPPYNTLEVPLPPLSQHIRPPSPVAMTSPLEGLKRSVADSTISDDLLPQPSMGLDDYTESPISRFYDRNSKAVESPKRVSLDDRITQALGMPSVEQKQESSMFANYDYMNSTQLTYAQYSQQFAPLPKQENELHMPKPPLQHAASNFVQVGNMVRIVPTDDYPCVPQDTTNIPVPPSDYIPNVPKVEKSHIVQVGNMLQIVPADMSPEPPLPPEPAVEMELEEPQEMSAIVQEKQSAEAAMKLKIAELRAERQKRREEREKRRKEKEKRRKEKEKKRQIKLKQRAENMIKKALQLEEEGGAEDDDLFLNETPTQWPPLPVVVSNITKEVGKSILIRGGQNKNDSIRDKRKIVQFADGVRPGEGTSPSGGEELSSPPPANKKLPKEKRYKKSKLFKKNQKKKVKVKIIKKRSEAEDSDEEDNLPPPSPPPGSPPPHVFPPRIKTHAINNLHPYVQTSQLYRPPLNIIMHHHPPPPPPHHGGPPPPHHGGPPPPHHHGPPPPPGPPHHHHGPPPPGPPHFHPGPPRPPHHIVPMPPHGPPGSWRPSPRPSPRPGSPWHQGPPPPYHH